MTGICEIMPDSKYDIKSVTMDEDRGHVSYFAVFSGTHIGEGGPVPPTNKWGEVDYVYVLEFQNNKISHLTKIFNPHYINKQMGVGFLIQYGFFPSKFLTHNPMFQLVQHLRKKLLQHRGP